MELETERAIGSISLNVNQRECHIVKCPDEILLQVASLLDLRSQCRPSLVSHRFRAISQDCIYKEIELPQPSPRRKSPIPALVRTLDRRPDLARSVRDLSASVMNREISLEADFFFDITPRARSALRSRGAPLKFLETTLMGTLLALLPNLSVLELAMWNPEYPVDSDDDSDGYRWRDEAENMDGNLESPWISHFFVRSMLDDLFGTSEQECDVDLRGLPGLSGLTELTLWVEYLDPAWLELSPKYLHLRGLPQIPRIPSVITTPAFRTVTWLSIDCWSMIFDPNSREYEWVPRALQKFEALQDLRLDTFEDGEHSSLTHGAVDTLLTRVSCVQTRLKKLYIIPEERSGDCYLDRLGPVTYLRDFRSLTYLSISERMLIGLYDEAESPKIARRLPPNLETLCITQATWYISDWLENFLEAQPSTISNIIICTSELRGNSHEDFFYDPDYFRVWDKLREAGYTIGFDSDEEQYSEDWEDEDYDPRAYELYEYLYGDEE